jgi:hypothetical protein
MAVDAVAVLSGFSQHALLSRVASGAAVTEAESAANDSRYALIGLFQVLMFVATAICWLVWLHRAYANLRLMGGGKADYGTGWVVGYWFIPVMNLFRPYQVTKELWLRSAQRNAAESIKELRPPSVVSWWWTIYVISGFLGQALLRWSRRATEIGELQGVTILGIILDSTSIVSAVLALAVVRRIDAFQHDAVSGLARPAPFVARA